MAKREFTKAESRNIVRGFQEGLSISSLARDHKCHHSVIRRVIQDTRSTDGRVRHAVDPKAMHRLVRLYQSGEFSGADVASEIGCSIPTALSKLRLNGVRIRPRGRPQVIDA